MSFWQDRFEAAVARGTKPAPVEINVTRPKRRAVFGPTRQAAEEMAKFLGPEWTGFALMQSVCGYFFDTVLLYDVERARIETWKLRDWISHSVEIRLNPGGQIRFLSEY